MDQKTKINYIYSTVYQILSIILPLVTTPYISRVLSVDSIGVYSFTASIVSYFVLVASFSFQTYGQREAAYKKNDKEKLSILFFEIQIKKLIFTLLAYGSFVLFFIETSQYKTMYLIQSITIVSAFFDITYLFQGMEQFRLTVVRNTAVKLVGLLLTLIFVKKQTDVYLYAIIQTVTVLLGNLSLWLYLPEFISFKFNIILIPQFGACGAAVASVGSEIVTLIIQGFFAKEYIDLNLIIKNAIKYLGVAAIMYAVISLIKILIQGQVGMFTLTLLLIISGIAVYFSILLFTKDDILSDIRKSFNGRFRRL